MYFHLSASAETDTIQTSIRFGNQPLSSSLFLPTSTLSFWIYPFPCALSSFNSPLSHCLIYKLKVPAMMPHQEVVVLEAVIRAKQGQALESMGSHFYSDCRPSFYSFSYSTCNFKSPSYPMAPELSGPILLRACL